MFPESQQLPPVQPSPQPETNPANYLDQIAAKPQKRFGFWQQKPIMIGLIAVGAILLVMLVVSLLPKNVNPSLSLATQLLETKTIAEGASTKLKDSELRSTNGNLKIYLENTIRDIKPFLSKSEVNIDKLAQSVKTNKSTTEITTRLEDARLNAVYDSTYAREMAYKLSSIITLYSQVEKRNTSSSFSTFIDKAKKDLIPTQQQFADFNSENS